MDVRTIISDLYNSKELKKTLDFIQPESIREDLKQHVFLGLLEQPEEKIIDLHTRGKLKSFVCKILQNTQNWKRTPFERNGNPFGKELNFDINILYSVDDSEDDKPLFPKYIKERVLQYEMVEYQNEFVLEQSEELNHQIAVSKNEMGEKSWYKEKLFDMYVEMGTTKNGKFKPCTYKALSEKTNIPITSLFSTIKEIKKDLKRKVLKEMDFKTI